MMKFATMTKMMCVLLFAFSHSSIGDSTPRTNDKRAAYKAIVGRLYEEVFNTGDLSRADELIAANYLDHNPLGPEIVRGLEGFKQSLRLLREAFPDLHFTVEEIIVKGNQVVSRVILRGTHKSEFMGVPPTGKRVQVKGIDLFRITNGVIVERWGAFYGKALIGQWVGNLPTISI